jgi:hypothetical protein
MSDTTMHVDRRTAIRWVAMAAAALRMPSISFDAVAAGAAAHGYGKDPALTKVYKPGEAWPLTFTPAQRKTVTLLADLIIPTDFAPCASAVGVVEFLDEWVSAPYPDFVRDRDIVLRGLQWMDAEAQRRFKRDFVSLELAQAHAICDDISARAPAEQFFEAAGFFSKFRGLVAAGYYTTPIGMKDIGYIGNEPLTVFEGPPPAVLKKLGLA